MVCEPGELEPGNRSYFVLQVLRGYYRYNEYDKNELLQKV